MRTPIRYALWSMLIIAPAMFILPAFMLTMSDLRAPLGADTGPMAATAAIMALMVSAFVAPAIVLPEGRGFPAWSVAFVIAGFVQLFAVLLMCGSGTPDGVVSGAYLPGALVCLNLTALIVIHAWVASAGMGFSPAVGLATGGAYSLWLLRVSMSQELDAFQGLSAVGLLVAFTAGIVAAFVGSAYAQTSPAPEHHGSA